MKSDTRRDYALHHPSEILAIVERLRRERAPTAVTFADGHAIVSSILAIRRDADALVFDVARDSEQNRRLFASPTLDFATELDHVQIAFETGAASSTALPDGPAAVVALPSSVVRLQRRGSFRAALPVQPPIRCTVIDGSGNAMPARAIDLSAEGTALVVDDPCAALAMPGSGHELVLSLPQVGRVQVEATLRTVTPGPRTTDGTSKVRLGFRFESLPSETTYRLQRYVQQLEVTQLRVLRARERE